MNAPFAMNSYLGMRILALVRDGDYAHAGEEEAIERAMAGVEKDAGRIILDAGCGRGGTADYLHKHGWGRVIGIDIQAESIEAARRNYPESTFLAGDVCESDRRVAERPDLICMFNAYYCFKDQPGALRSLRTIARPRTRMIVFDHVDRGGYQDDPLMDAGEPFLPRPDGRRPTSSRSTTPISAGTRNSWARSNAPATRSWRSPARLATRTSIACIGSCWMPPGNRSWAPPSSPRRPRHSARFQEPDGDGNRHWLVPEFSEKDWIASPRATIYGIWQFKRSEPTR
jgi:SAM-dependent methyltransferase